MQATGTGSSAGNDNSLFGSIYVPVATYVGQATVAQQALDRLGPDVSFDEIFMAQLGRELGTQLDNDIIGAVLGMTGLQSVASAGASVSNAQLFDDFAHAASLLSDAQGTRLEATHLFAKSDIVRKHQSLVDSTGRPIWLPSGSTFVSNAGIAEGFSGYDILGAGVWFNNQLANFESGGSATLLVGAPKEALVVYDSAPVLNIYPEWGAASLTAGVRVVQYAAFSVQYPSAFAKITGSSAYPSSVTF